MDIKHTFFKPVVLATALLAGTFAVSDKADATLVLTLQSGASSATVVDNGVGDLDPHFGMIGFMGAVGAFSMNLVGGIGNAMAPWPTLIDLHGMNMSSTAGGTLVATLEDDGYVPAAPLSTLLSLIGGTVGAGGTLSTRTFIDASNTAGVLGTMLTDHGSFPSGAFSSELSSGPTGTPAPYGLAIQVTITHAAAALSSYDHEIRISEPATLGLFGLALTLIGGLTHWRRRC